MPEYEKHVWKPGDSVTSRRLNNIETGLSSALNRVVNIEAYFSETRVEGVTDDSAALRSALIAAQNGYLRLNRAVLRLEKSVSVSVSNIIIDAFGAKIDLIDDGSAAGVVFEIHDSQRVALVGGLYRQSAATRSGVYGVLTMRNVVDWTMDDVSIIGSSSTGIFVLGGSRFWINRPDVRDTKADGIHVSRGSTDWFIVHPRIMNTGDDGIGIISVTKEPSDPGVTYPQIARGVIIDPMVSDLSAVGGGVSLVGVKDCALRGGVIENVATSGIKITTDSLAGAPQEPQNVLVQGTVTRDSVKGLSVGPSFDVYLDSVQAMDNDDVGIEVNGATRLILDGGKYRGSVFGIYEAAGTGNYAINADVRGNSQAPIQKQSLISERCIGLEL